MTINRKGFTLVEMLVSMSVFVVALGATSTLLISVLNVYSLTLTTQALSRDGRNAFESFNREVRLAQLLFDSDNPPTVSNACRSRNAGYDGDANHRIILKDTGGNTFQSFYVKNFVGEIIEYKVVKESGNYVFVADNLGKICEAGQTPPRIRTTLTPLDSNINSLEIIKDIKYGTINPPALIIIKMDLQRTTSRQTTVSHDGQATISIRGEQCLYFPDRPECTVGGGIRCNSQKTLPERR